MPYLTQLAEVARRTGYPVTEIEGWKSRGHGEQAHVQGVVAHHTAGPKAGGDYPSLNTVKNGRPGLDGPLSHFGLGRSGHIYVIAAGRCWHNAPSTGLKWSNSYSIGIEAENDGKQAWPKEQLDAYYKLCAEICKEWNLSASVVKGHKEVNTAKIDPHSLNMNDFRSEVAKEMTGAGHPASSVKAPAWPGVYLKYPPTTNNSAVKTWQTKMKSRGWSITVDGIYGPDSEKVCLQFQKEKGLPADGIVGPVTWRATWEEPVT